MRMYNLTAALRAAARCVDIIMYLICERVYVWSLQGGNWSEIPLPVSDSFLPESDRYLNGADWQQALRKISVPVVLGVTANDGLASLGETTDPTF